MMHLTMSILVFVTIFLSGCTNGEYGECFNTKHGEYCLTRPYTNIEEFKVKKMENVDIIAIECIVKTGLVPFSYDVLTVITSHGTFKYRQGCHKRNGNIPLEILSNVTIYYVDTVCPRECGITGRILIIETNQNDILVSKCAGCGRVHSLKTVNK